MINRRRRNIITRQHKNEPTVMATTLLKEMIDIDVLKNFSARGKKNSRPGLSQEILAAVEGEFLKF
jgi:hypothetical protein